MSIQINIHSPSTTYHCMGHYVACGGLFSCYTSICLGSLVFHAWQIYVNPRLLINKYVYFFVYKFSIHIFVVSINDTHIHGNKNKNRDYKRNCRILLGRCFKKS